MTSFNQNFTMVAGDTKTINFTVLDENGDAVDLSSATAKWQCTASDANGEFTGAAAISKTEIDGITLTANVASVLVDAGDSTGFDGFHYQEFEVTIGGAVSTVASGVITFKKELIT